jgi:hypothetical protein
MLVSGQQRISQLALTINKEDFFTFVKIKILPCETFCAKTNHYSTGGTNIPASFNSAFVDTIVSRRISWVRYTPTKELGMGSSLFQW